MPKVRLIDDTGKFFGVIDTLQALEMARKKELDLVEINPKEIPPIAKIMDFGQFKYEQSKKEKKAKAKQAEIKGIRLSLRMGKHDIGVRTNRTKEFLEEKNKVQIEMILRGRERTHLDLAEQIINQFIDSLGKNIKIEQPLKKQGGRLTVLISPC